MVFFNYTTMQVSAKIVYYGPGLCGKTTNLQQIHSRTESGSRGEMVSLETEADRTLFFDLLPLEVGTIGGMRVRLQLYTVPGQVFYNTTRKLVLKGVDGIVFVADSQVPAFDANVESMENLEKNLSELGVSLEPTPMVLQFNKRDLRNIHSMETLNKQLNRRGLEVFEGAALHGIGVFETLKAISRKTLAAVHRRITGSGRAMDGAAAAASPASAAQRVALIPSVAPSTSSDHGEAKPPPPSVSESSSLEPGTRGVHSANVDANIDTAEEVRAPVAPPQVADSDTSEVKIEFAANETPDHSGAGELDVSEVKSEDDSGHQRVVTKSSGDIERELEQLRTLALGASTPAEPTHRILRVQEKTKLALSTAAFGDARRLAIDIRLESEDGASIEPEQTLAIELPPHEAGSSTRVDLEIDLDSSDSDGDS